MNRSLFYALLLFQVGILAMFSWQYFLIDYYGETVIFVTEKKDNSWFQSYDYRGNIYLTYEINMIPQDKWEIDEELDYNDLVYVLLEKDDAGQLHVQKASTKKIDQTSEQILLKGKYQYYESSPNSKIKKHKVYYGIEKVARKDLIDQNLSSHPLEVIVKISPWKQMKIVDIRGS